jgi:O-antigen ligase
VLFFLLPIALCTGRGSQAGGIYFFAVIFPAILHRNSIRFPGLPLLGLGSLFLAMFYVFPVADLLQLSFRSSELAQIPWSFPKIMNESRFSSSLGITGLYFLLFAYLRKRQLRNSLPVPNLDIFQIFTSGLVVGLAALSIYVAIQFFTGFNFSEVAEYRPDRHMGPTFYRVTGFANHPVSFAGFSLVILAYYWTFFCSRPIAKARESLSIQSLVIVGLNFVFIFLSGSRIAVLVGLFLLCLIPFFSTHYSKKSRVIVFLSAILLAISLVFASGIHHRFLEVLGDSGSNGFGDRKFFWQVHWHLFLESPWIGNGRYFVDHYFRLKSYNDLGFQLIENKYNAHNVYLEVLSNVGIIGSLLLFGLAFSALKLLKNGLTGVNSSIHYRCFVGALSASLLFGFAQNSFFDTPTMLITLGFLWMMFWHRNYAGISD